MYIFKYTQSIVGIANNIDRHDVMSRYVYLDFGESAAMLGRLARPARWGKDGARVTRHERYE